MKRGSIAALGSHYSIGLKAVDCVSGDSLGNEQVESESKEQVLKALGAAAVTLLIFSRVTARGQHVIARLGWMATALSTDRSWPGASRSVSRSTPTTPPPRQTRATPADPGRG